MNIFVIESDPTTGFPCPVRSAQSQLDKHVVKMPLETAQILSTIAHNQGYSEAIYKPTHRNHPCTLWAGASLSNYRWLTIHGLALSQEYTARYGKTHASQRIIEQCDQLTVNLDFDVMGFTPFAQAMPDEYRGNDAVEAYRRYYRAEKASIATWKRNQPDWWIVDKVML